MAAAVPLALCVKCPHCWRCARTRSTDASSGLFAAQHQKHAATHRSAFGVVREGRLLLVACSRTFFPRCMATVPTITGSTSSVFCKRTAMLPARSDAAYRSRKSCYCCCCCCIMRWQGTRLANRCARGAGTVCNQRFCYDGRGSGMLPTAG